MVLRKYYKGRCVSHLPWAFFYARLLDNKEVAKTERYVWGKLSTRCSMLYCSTKKRLPRPNDTESSRRDVLCSIARQQRGCQDRTIRLGKALDEMFPAPSSVATVETIELGKIGSGGGVTYTRVYGGIDNIVSIGKRCFYASVLLFHEAKQKACAYGVMYPNVLYDELTVS